MHCTDDENISLKMMNYHHQRMNPWTRTSKITLQMMNFVLQMMTFAFKCFVVVVAVVYLDFSSRIACLFFKNDGNCMKNDGFCIKMMI